MAVAIVQAHVSINVKNLAVSLEFYRKLFAIEPTKVRTAYANFKLSNPPLNFTLNEQSFNEPGALSHLGFQVSSTDDVLAIREQWHQLGLVTRDEMQTNCCFATQDKTWVLDPDGNEWEVFVVLKDDLPEESIQAEAACCLPAEHGALAAGASCGCNTSADVQ